jgi:threonine dehydratase
VKIMPNFDFAAIQAAQHQIDPVFLNTPVAGHRNLDAALGCSFVGKVETLNPIRSFKGRGTEFYAAALQTKDAHLVCASAGNFGQGLARAAAKRGFACTVFAATGANKLKIAAMRDLGADVRLEGADFDAAKDAARAFAAARGARFVEDGAEPEIAAGAGTIGLELGAQVPDLDDLLVPLGNGALLAGVGAAMRAVQPSARIVAVVASGAPSMKMSLDSGRLVQTPTASTIADGIAVRVPVPEALAMLAGRWDETLAIDEADLVRAMRLVHETLGLVVEPAGIAGVAALLAHPARFAGRRTASILCGGNVAKADLRRWLFDAA